MQPGSRERLRGSKSPAWRRRPEDRSWFLPALTRGRCAIVRQDNVDRFRSTSESVKGLRLQQDLFDLFDVIARAQPFAGSQADDAAEDLCDALNEKKQAGGDNDR